MHNIRTLCNKLLELERAMSALGQGLPEEGTDKDLADAVAEVEVYEAEFVLPVSAAELQVR